MVCPPSGVSGNDALVFCYPPLREFSCYLVVKVFPRMTPLSALFPGVTRLSTISPALTQLSTVPPVLA